MDSLTQLTLGAACGEAVLGKKIGNRAMFWGAIGGTIPDLDVFANFVADDITALAFHRGITHSLFFAFLAPLLFGWLVHRLYSSGLYRKKGWKVGNTLFWLLILVGLINAIGASGGGGFNATTFIWSMGISVILGILFWRFFWRKESREVHTTRANWTSLFFWSIFTHPLLDSCTTYGTQLFQPFWDYRVAFNNISVADPIYTLPFLVLLLIVLFLRRQNRWRRLLNWTAIGLSSAYLLLTFYNKVRVDHIFENSLAANGITYERYMTSPTILNNILWNGLAEGDSSYYYAMYSFYDDQKAFLDIQEVPKRHHYLEGHQEDRDISILTWFSNDYYTLFRDSTTGNLMYYDLRFGTMNGSMENQSDFVFGFEILTEDEIWEARESENGPPVDDFGAFWKRYWDRVFSREDED
ncbi:MAG: metal-dependent hydrolase [Bacteroidetes bacterium]|nr:metal-dependent hydrolase [Bacteroidota bacterium]